MRRVLITGASGYIGGKLAAYLATKPEVEEIVGTDIRAPSIDAAKVVFYNRDVRFSIEDILKKHAVDTVVHTAFVLPPSHDTNLMEDINVNGTMSVLSSAIGASVSRFLYTSSATAYGFHPDNRRPLTEESPLRGNEDFTYSRTKRIIEGMLGEFVHGNCRVEITIVRPCFVVGPGFDNPLATYLRRAVVPIPLTTEPVQFVHEDDLVEIIFQLLARDRTGAYNVGADGTITVEEMVKLLGNKHIRIPYPLLSALNQVAWLLRLSFLTEFPSPALNMIRYPWVVDSDKLKREINYSYRYTSREAFEDFAESARGD